MKIQRHRPEFVDLLDDCEYNKDMLKKNLDWVQTESGKLGSLAGNALNYAGYVSMKDSSSSEIHRSLRLAAYTYTCIFELATSNPGEEELEVFVGEGNPSVLGSTGPTSYSNGVNWLDGFYLAAACREPHLNDRLVAIPEEVMRQSRTRCDDYLYLQISALKGFWQNDPKTPQMIIDALSATDPERVTVGTVDAALNLAVPEIDLLYRLAQGDADGFNQAMTKALKHHKKHWSKKAYESDPRGFLAYGPLGLASIAYERSIKLEVESEYIPDYIVAALFEAR